MKYQRINLAPLARILRPHGPHDGVPVRWEAPDAMALPPLPDAEAWVVVEDRPEFDPATQRLERVLTTERDGWDVVNLTEEELAARNQPQPVTKLTIKRRLESLGKWETFKAVLAQSPASVQDEWTLAQDIRPNDPIFSANKEGFRLALGLTEDEFNGLLTSEQV